jgi:hypothetical protein
MPKVVAAKHVRKKDFAAYVKVQQAGRFNMITEARSAAASAGLPMPVYMSVIEHYDELAAKWPGVCEEGG